MNSIVTKVDKCIYLLKYVVSMKPEIPSLILSSVTLLTVSFCFFFLIFSNFSSGSGSTFLLTFLKVTLLPPGPTLESTTWRQSFSVSWGRILHLFTIRTQALQISPCLLWSSLSLKHRVKEFSYLPLSVNLELLDLALQMQHPSPDLNTLGLWYELIFISRNSSMNQKSWFDKKENCDVDRVSVSPLSFKFIPDFISFIHWKSDSWNVYSQWGS